MDETIRQVSHLVFGIGISAMISLLEKQLVVALLMLAIFAGLILSELVSKGYHIPLVSAAVNLMERKDAVPGKGALNFAVGSLFALILFDPVDVAPAVLALAVLDSVATLIGIRYGRHRFWNHKSVEGTVSGITVTTLVLFLLLPPSYALIAAVIAGVVELLSPVDDNLLVPVVVAAVLSVLL